MVAKSHIDIKGTKEQIWAVITDIENSKETISGITSIEVLNDPEDTFIGYKWREGRVMFGKEATEVMWITDAVENSFYQTRAESHGAIYISKLIIDDLEDSCRLTMTFEAEPMSFFAKLSGKIFAKMMKKSTEEAFYKDLVDIKKKVEGQ